MHSHPSLTPADPRNLEIAERVLRKLTTTTDFPSLIALSDEIARLRSVIEEIRATLECDLPDLFSTLKEEHRTFQNCESREDQAREDGEEYGRQQGAQDKVTEILSSISDFIQEHKNSSRPAGELLQKLHNAIDDNF